MRSMRLLASCSILSAPGMVPSISRLTVMPPFILRLLNSALISPLIQKLLALAFIEKWSKMRSQLPSILIRNASLHTGIFSAWTTESGLYVPWNPCQTIAAGRSPISPEYAFSPVGIIDPAPWPCSFQVHASMLAESRNALPCGTRRVRSAARINERGGAPPTGAGGPPTGAGAGAVPPAAAGTLPLASGERLVIAVMFAVIGTARNMGAAGVRQPQYF